MKRKVFCLCFSLICYLFSCQNNQSNPGGENEYTGGDITSFENQIVTKELRQKAIDRLKSVSNLEVDTNSNLFSIKTNEIDENAFDGSITTYYENELSETIEMKWDGSILYLHRIHTDGDEEQWFKDDFEIYRNNKKGTVERQKWSQTSLQMVTGIIEMAEKSLEYDKTDSDNYYIMYQYQEGEYSQTPIESERYGQLIKIGFVSSFLKEIILEDINRESPYDIKCVFSKWNINVEIPLIPNVE